MSEKEVKLCSEESLLPTHAFRAKLDKIFSDLKARRRAVRSPEFAAASWRSRMAAQQTAEIAVAVAEMAAAEGRFGAVIELIIDAAMVRAIGTPGKVLNGAMIAEPRQQEARFLPVHADGKSACRQGVEAAGGAGR